MPMSILSQGNRVRRVSLDAMLCAFCLILSYLEVLIPFEGILPFPGFRLGLCNFAVLAVFCLLSPLDAAIVSGMRILLMGMLFGTATSFYFSVLGGICSFLMLLLLRAVRTRCSFIGVSILSAAAHNTGQMLAAVTLFGFSLIPTYLPFLLMASVLYGGLIGMLLNLAIPKLQPHFARGRSKEGDRIDP